MIASPIVMTSLCRIAFLSVLNVFFLSTVLGFLPVKTPTRGVCSGPAAGGGGLDLGVQKIHRSRRWRNNILWSSSDENDQDSLSRHLIDSLDLAQIIEEVARHTATRRGYSAFLSIIQRNHKTKTLSTNRQQRFYDSTKRTKESRLSLLAPIAKSLEEVHSEYALVEEAALLLVPENNTNLTCPPIYGEHSSPYDIDTIPQTDDDEWLDLAPEQFTAEHILQAEQVISNLLKIREWSQREEIQKWTPTIAQMGSTIDKEENLLPSVYLDIAGNIQIVRVKSLTDPSGKSSYSIKVKEDDFPVLRLLNEQELKLLNNGAKELDKGLVAIRAEIEETTNQILSSLAQKVLSASTSLDHGLEVMARLDTLMAKAAYSLSLNGVVPIVKTDGEILIENFLHPILLTTMVDRDRVVPIDLRLSSDAGESALVISGPNGGGKTLSMKSFGLVSILTKLGIPIPIKEGGKRPRVDYFDEIFVNVGDQQSVMDGESTWTSILNSCAITIQRITEQRKEGDTPSHLVLLDELGTGTDPESGGAVAQAILEELIANSCKVVVTTHLPRLKTLSYNDVHIGCAAVLLDYNDLSTFRRPSFKLEYGLIGESHALNAASRCVPSLPDAVLSRASSLLNDVGMTEENETHNSYIQALTSSMEEQLERSRIATSSLQDDAIDSLKCRQAMVSLARAYECHLDRKLEYLEASFQKMKANGQNEYELVGETLSELKVVKKRIVSQEEKLASKGLKVVSTNRALSPGESVVIISNGEWEGMTATVIADGLNNDASLAPNQVLVKPSFSSHAWEDVMIANIDPLMDRTLILQRQEIASWDIDSIYDDYTSQSKPATSIANSKQRINSLFSTIDSVSKKKKGGNSPKKKEGKKFQSSRQRKAANKAKKK